MVNAARELKQLWDNVVDGWLEGGSTIPEELQPWFNAYSGTGRGEVDPEAFPEPFLGDLTTEPAGVVLALNPGEVFPDFQYRNGHFAREIRHLGSYSRWAATWPYLRDEGPRLPKGRGRKFHNMRWSFLKNWYRAPSLPASKMLAFELYPWHSTGLTAPILMSSPDVARFIERYIWEPIIDTGTPYVFGVGKDWFPVLSSLATDEVVTLGRDGERCHFNEPTRTVLVARGPNDILIIGNKIGNVASPIPAADVEVLLHELLRRGILKELPTWRE